MPRPTVKIKHGDFEADVSPRAAKAYERNGWTVVDDGSSEPEAAPVEEEPKPAKKTTSRKAE
jgi:hypothetical protein